MAVDWYTTISIGSWRDFQREYEDRFALTGRQWVFRGHRDAVWDLKPSLERSVCDRFELPCTKMIDVERYLVDYFRRNLHRYQARVPAQDDVLEWLALMQHHGAPTRLLDWTYSCYVALFFALEAARPAGTCAVWAVDQIWLYDTLKARSEFAAAFAVDPKLRTPEAHRAILECRVRFVAPLVPYFSNERMAVQQGVFLAPLDLSTSFMDNLQAVAPAADLRQRVLKLEIPITRKPLYQMLMSLERLNVNRISLFPGLDGFAQNLQLSPLWWHPDSRR
jgi:hypothetical protein